MTLIEANELLDYWSSHPPINLMIEAYLGVEPSGRTDNKEAVIQLAGGVKPLPDELRQLEKRKNNGT